MKKKKEKAFSGFRANAISLRFPNSNWISTIWDGGSYTENHDKFVDSPHREEFMDSDDVEVMISCPDKLHKRIHKKFDGDRSVIGHLTMPQWLEIIRLISK